MNRSRLLLALPAATALVLAGASPALAGGDGHHEHGNDAWAKVVEIDDEAELEDRGDVLEVTFEYKCEDDGEDVTADVTAENGDIRYEEDDVDLRCDGDRREKTVELAKEEDEAEKGDEVDVTVTINANGDQLAEETEQNVEVVDEDDGDDGDRHHHDHDKRDHHHGH